MQRIPLLPLLFWIPLLPLLLIIQKASGSSGATLFPLPTNNQAAERSLPGMPPVLQPSNIYAADATGQLSPVVKNFPTRVYVPNSESASVDVIDPATYKIIDHFSVGNQPQHIVPSWDLKTLWVLDDKGNDLTKIDPATGKKGATVPVDDPYNLYFTPDGKSAIVVAEALHRLDFRDPQTMKLQASLSVPCSGANHLDYSLDGRLFILSCEYDGRLLKIDVKSRKILGTIELGDAPGGVGPVCGAANPNPLPAATGTPRMACNDMPQDVRSSPDGTVFYVADMMANGVHEIDPYTFKKIGFLATGKGAHGFFVSRDAKYLYVSNRGEGSFSVIDFATRQIVAKWWIPNGGSPDMGGLSADGKVLWAGGRYNGEVYALDVSTGKLIARIRVGKGPHGLCIYPQPGRYSLGHTGNMR